MKKEREKETNKYMFFVGFIFLIIYKEYTLLLILQVIIKQNML